MTERQVTELAAWWRQAAVREDLERALQALKGRTETGTRAETLAASLNVLVRAARSTGVVVEGWPEEVAALRDAEDVLNAVATLFSRQDYDGDGVHLLERTLDTLLAFPSRKMAIYGSLAPGEVNHHVIAALRGSWRDGFVRGHVSNVGWGADYGFPALTWNSAGPKVSVKLFVAAELPEHWERIDRFEGDGYQRILIPVEDAGGVVAIANIYVARTT